MATPARPVDPFAGPTLTQRTSLSAPYAYADQGFIQNGPQIFTQTPLSNRTERTGTKLDPFRGFQQSGPTGRIVAGVSPESQARYNFRRAQSGRAPIIPSHLDTRAAGKPIPRNVLGPSMAGGRPETQREMNMYREPNQLDPLAMGAQFLFT